MGAMNDAADQGLEHLQTAAREMVSAARSFLDAIEDVIEDRERFGPIVSGLADLVERAGSMVSSVAESPTATASSAAAATATTPKRAPRVQRIKVE